MNNNRCLYCNKIIPKGRQICPTCESEQAQFLKEIKSIRNVTPENAFCFDCKRKCRGECKEYKEYVAGLRKQSQTGRLKRGKYNK
jgi:hypothetical protein